MRRIVFVLASMYVLASALVTACDDDPPSSTIGFADAGSPRIDAGGSAPSDAAPNVVDGTVAVESGADAAADADADTDADADADAESDAGADADADADAGPACQGLTSPAQTYKTADRATFLAAFPDRTLLDLETRNDGQTPVAGTDFASDEYASKGVTVTLDAADATAKLIWAGNSVGGFGARLSCASPVACTGDIVITFSQPQRAAGVDYPGNVRAVFKRPDGTVLVDTGDISGAGDNFVALASDQPIGSITLIRAAVNEVSGIAFAACK